jgi:hypothetical protein
MKDAPGVGDARKLFTSKHCANIADFNASFGVIDGAAPGYSIAPPWGGGGYLQGTDGQFHDTIFGPVPNLNLMVHPTRQILGSYSVDITNNGNGTATFDVSNTMSNSSATYHLGPDFPNGQPSGNTEIDITWRESTSCY